MQFLERDGGERLQDILNQEVRILRPPEVSKGSEGLKDRRPARKL